MYSYEDRLRAVRLYIKLGKRVRLTIRQLGYPTKNALKSWHREFERRLDLPVGYVRGPKYSDAQKETAARHYLDNGRCLAATIRTLGYPSRKLLSVWVSELDPQAGVRIVGPSRAFSPDVKQAAVIALCLRQASAESLAQELGVSRPTLYNWKDRLLGHDAPAFMKRKKRSPPRRGTRGVGAAARGAATGYSAPATRARPAEEGERTPKKRPGHRPTA